MRIYPASSEETLRASKLLKEWASEGFLTREQYDQLEKETVSELRTTNIFLRIVLFFFTLIIVSAVGGLFMVSFDRSAYQTMGVFLLVYAILCYCAAEMAVAQARLYRYGIEEALAVCSIACLCVGAWLTFFAGSPYSPSPNAAQFLVPAAGALSSLWIWHRFGLWYAFPAAMIFTLVVPDDWTSSHAVRHLMVASFYVVGVVLVISLASRHRGDYTEDGFSVAEAFLWLGIYLALNLQISPPSLRVQWLIGSAAPASEFARPFYWATWVLIWILPPVVLARGIRKKDRFVMAVGAIVLILTFITNKPYVGWHRHTWDPMLLGVLLIGATLLIRRWLSRGPNGIRYGFTAARLSGKDKRWMSIGSTALGLAIPQAITPQAKAADFGFGGGASGGGGAGGEY